MAVLQSALVLTQAAHKLPEHLAFLRQAGQGAHAEAELLAPLYDCCCHPCSLVVVQL